MIQDDAAKRLRFEKFLERTRLDMEQDLNKFKDDSLAIFQTNVRLSTLEYIHRIYELTFNGHICNMEKLK